MAVYQINVWVCEVCGIVQSTSENVSPYSDPVVVPPERGQIGSEWDYVWIDGKELHACPECVAQHEQTLKKR